MVNATRSWPAQAVRLAAETPGPVYVRLSRASTPVILGEDYRLDHCRPGAGYINIYNNRFRRHPFFRTDNDSVSLAGKNGY